MLVQGMTLLVSLLVIRVLLLRLLSVREVSLMTLLFCVLVGQWGVAVVVVAQIVFVVRGSGVGGFGEIALAPCVWGVCRVFSRDQVTMRRKKTVTERMRQRVRPFVVWCVLQMIAMVVVVVMLLDGKGVMVLVTVIAVVVLAAMVMARVTLTVLVLAA